MRGYKPGIAAAGEAEEVSSSPRAGRSQRLVYAAGFAAGIAIVLALGVRFPNELRQLQENQATIFKLQQENNRIRKERDEKQEQLRIWKENHQELELELRKELKLHKPDEKIYVVPKKPAPATPTAP